MQSKDDSSSKSGISKEDARSSDLEISQVVPEEFITFAEKIKSGIAVVRDSTVVYANPVIEGLTGYSRKEIASRDFWELTDPEYVPIARERTSKANNSGDPGPMDYPIITKDGSRVWLNVETNQIEWNGQKFLMVTCFDVTERKRTEFELQQNRERMGLILESANIAVWEWDLKDMKVFFSDRWPLLLGYKFGEIEFDENTWKEHVHPDDMDSFLRAQNDYYEGRTELFNAEYRMRTKDGTWKWFMDSGQILKRDERGEPLIASGIHMDVTRKNEALQRLRGSEEKYLAVLEFSPNNIYLVDTETMRIIESNTTLQNLLGYSADELLGMKPYDFIAHDQEDINNEIGKLPNGQYGFVGPRKYRTKDGRVIDVEVSANIINYNGREVISVVSWDVSDLKRVQEELIELNQILRLIARITRHDIRNRLTIAYGILDLMRTGNTLDPVLIEEAHKSVRKSIDITKRMNQLENLMISGKEKKEIDLRDKIEDIIVDYPVKYRIDGNATVGVDTAFDSVIENIIGNAIFHGGADRIVVRIIEDEGFVLISIADDGIGVDEKLRDKIFQESFSYGENRGTGLGLYIVKKVIERYGGEVWMEDTIPKGATFVIKIPKLEESIQEEIVA
jgi:PAS domain S-box-containing protein